MSRKLTVIQLGPTDYDEALQFQKELALKAGASAARFLILLNHPPVVTIGRSGKDEHILASAVELERRGILLRETDRGGDVTFHGPGQIVGYPILDLRDRARDIHAYLRDLESVLIETLARFSIQAGRVQGRTGVWVGERKIAAIGVAIRRWITYHGFALNVNTGLDYFNLIVPCGISDREVTSMAELLGSPQDEIKVRRVLADHFASHFGFTEVTEIEAEDLPDARSALRLYHEPDSQ